MKKVITYGTFDLFHEGHYNILKRAKALGDYLIVGVTSESYDIERGKLNVRDSLLKRIENVRRTGFADEIIIEEYQGQKLSDIIKYKVDLLVLGSDWRGKFDYLKNYCDVVYLERTKNISSTKLRGEGTMLFLFNQSCRHPHHNSAIRTAAAISYKCFAKLTIILSYSFVYWFKPICYVMIVAILNYHSSVITIMVKNDNFLCVNCTIKTGTVREEVRNLLKQLLFSSR